MRGAVLFLIIWTVGVVSAAKIEKLDEIGFSVNGCGGITYVGGSNYWILRDHDETGNAVLYSAQIDVDVAKKKITASSVSSGIYLTGNKDSEGVAYDPGSGGLWISDELSMSIREFRPALAMTSVSPVAEAPVPAVYQKKSDGRGLEALTISPDGLTMWTANEEALTVDGERSSASVSTVVRLTRFVRSNRYAAWRVAGQWPYKCEQAKTSLVPSYEFCGVSGLCALPDGSLLVLERETSTTTMGRCEIYRLTLPVIQAATPIQEVPALKNLSSYAVANKGSALLSFQGGNLIGLKIIVYEGICLGPRQSDGSYLLMLVSDGGESKSVKVIVTVTARTVARLCAAKLSGLDAVEVGGVPVGWFDANGLKRDPSAPAPGKLGTVYGYTAGDAYAAGLSLEHDEPLKITGLSIEDGWLTLKFNAVPVAQDAVFRIFGASSLSAGEFVELTTDENGFASDWQVWQTTCTIRRPSGLADTGFYFIRGK